MQTQQSPKKRHDGFRTGSGCFKCAVCGKLTRTTSATSGTELCPDCCEVSMQENCFNDGVISHDEFVKIVKEHHREKWFLGGSDVKI